MSGVSKTIEKIQKSIADGNYYEAHQMVHSVSQRLFKQKKTQEAVALLFEGTQSMLNHQEFGSALDLVARLMDIYDTMENPDKDLFLNLFLLFPLKSPSCDDFVKMVLKWSSKLSNNPLGDPYYHHAFGSRYYAEGLFYDAEFHYVHGTLDSAKALGRMMVV